MSSLDYEEFKRIMNKHIFQSERQDLLRALVSKPERFVGLFRPSTPEGKIFQHIFQAREIKFGDAMEEVVGLLLQEYGYLPQDKRITENLECDHYFFYPDGGHALLIEQKVRDDHDSTKRHGQWNNFEAKVKVLFQRHERSLTAIFYFVDPSLRKNRAFYSGKVVNLRENLGLETIHLWYGEELFSKLTRFEDWERLVNWLKRWKREIPVMPDINWETKEAIDELQQIARSEPQLWLKFANLSHLWDEGIVRVLFPTGKGLQAIIGTLEGSDNPRAKKAAEVLKRKLETHNP